MKKSLRLFTMLSASLLLTACTSEAKPVEPSTSQSSRQETRHSSRKTVMSSTRTSSQSPASSNLDKIATSSDKGTQPTNSPSSAITQETPKTEVPSTGETSSTEVKSVSPGAAAGQWQYVKTGYVYNIRPDGTFVNSDHIIYDMVSEVSGQLTLHVGRTVKNSSGFLIYYYPAGVKIPLQLVKIVDGKTVIEPITDPTDSTRERIVSGNGNLLQVTQEQYDNYLDDVAYRP